MGELSFIPRLMPAPQAAHYMGISTSKLRQLDIPRKRLDGKRLYDRIDLEAYADALTEETSTTRENSCDAVFA